MRADSTGEASRFRDAHAVAVLAGILTLLFADVLFLGANFSHGDIFGFHFGLKSIVRDGILSGALPEWNQWLAAGQPLAANPQYELFYPPQWLILLPNFLYGFQLHIVLHLYVAALGMYAFLRSVRIGIAGALFGALAFGIGGLMLSHIALLPLFFALAWMPLVLAGGVVFLRTGSSRAASCGALALAMQFLIGEPVTALQTLLLLAGYALFRARKGEVIAGRVRGGAAIAAIICCAAALAAVQVVPTIDFARDSVRSIPLPYQAVKLWSFPIERLTEFVNPRAVGTTDVEGRYFVWGLRLYPGRSGPYYLSIYPGLLVGLFALAGVAGRVRGWAYALGGFALALLLALGDHTPLLRLLYDAGAASSVRYFEKFITMAVFIVIVFAARVFDEVAGGNRLVIRTAIAIAAGMALISLAIAAAPARIAERVFTASGGLQVDVATILLDRMRDGWRWTGITAAVAAALLFLAFRSERARAMVPLLLLAFAIIDLGARVSPLAPRESGRLFTPPTVASTVPAGARLWPRVEWYKPQDVGRRYRSRIPWYTRNTLSHTTPLAWHIRTVLAIDFDETALVPTVEFTDVFWEANRRRLPGWPAAYLAMSGVTHRTVFRPARELTNPDLEELAPVTVVSTAPASRYYFADEAVRVRDREDFMREVAKRPAARAAYVESAVSAPGRGAVRGYREGNDAIDIDVTVGREAALLVLAVTPHKYWRATIDGRPAELLRANIGYQAVVVPPGGRTVSLRYRNPLIRPMAVVSLLALAAALLLLAAGDRLLRRVSRAGSGEGGRS